MNLAASRPWLSAILLAVLMFLPSSASAGMSPEEVKAFALHKSKADKGDPAGQYNLGACYFTGEGVAMDKLEAAKWFRKAAEQGDSDALFYLGQ